MVPTIENGRAQGFKFSSLLESLRGFACNFQQLPPLSWLSPAVAVKLLRQSAPPELWIVGADSMRIRQGAKNFSAKFQAQEIPDELLLWRTLSFPVVAVQQLADAVALEVQSNSPFPVHDLVWGFQADSSLNNGKVSVQTVMASKSQIEQSFALSNAADSDGKVVEAWALSAGRSPIVVTGFGESARVRHANLWQKISYVLALVIFCVLLGIALTPSLQLRFRAMEAQAAFETERRLVEPIIKKRASYQDATERLSEIGVLTEGRLDPLWIMDRMTQIFPDDSSVLTLQAQTAKISVTGQTSNAATLMQHLSSQPGVRDVKAPVAAVRPPGAAKDSFSIELNLAPQQSASKPAVPASKAAP